MVFEETNITKDEWAEKIWIEILSTWELINYLINKIKISWTTEKSSSKIILNSKQDFTSTSNNEWYLKKI